MKFRLMALMIVLFCMCGDAWGLSTERSGLIYYPTDGANLIAMHNAVVTRGLPAHYKLIHTSSGETTPYIITSGVTFQEYETFEFENRARLAPASSQTITIYSPANVAAEPMQKIYDLSSGGTVAFTTGGTFRPGHWGLVGDGLTDDSTAMQAALTSFFAIDDETRGTFRPEPGYNYLIGSSLTHTFTELSVGNTVIDCRGAQFTSNLSSGFIWTIYAGDNTVRNIDFFPGRIVGGASEDGLIYLNGGANAAGGNFYNVRIIDPLLHNFSGDGIALDKHVFESEIIRPKVNVASDNTTGYGIHFYGTADGNTENIGIFTITQPNIRNGKHGIYVPSGVGLVNIYGGEAILAYEEGAYYGGANGDLISGFRVENNWQSATTDAVTNAGIRFIGNGTLLNVNGTTVDYQTTTASIFASGQGINCINVSAAGDSLYSIYNTGGTAGVRIMGDTTTIVQALANAPISRMGCLVHDVSSDSTSGATVETDLKSVTIPANTLGQTGGLEIRSTGQITDAAGGDKTVKFYLNAGNKTVQTAANVSGVWELVVKILSRSDSAQRVTYTFWLDGALVTHSSYQDAEDQTSDIDFKVTGQCSDATDAVIQNSMRADYI